MTDATLVSTQNHLIDNEVFGLESEFIGQSLQKINFHWLKKLTVLDGLDTPSFNITDDEWSNYIKKGISLISEEQFDLALKAFERSVELDWKREQFLASYLVGLTNYISENSKRALLVFKNILQIDSQQVIAEYYLSLCYIQDYDYVNAVKHLFQSKNKKLNYYKTDAAIGIIYSLIGDYQNSEKYISLANHSNSLFNNELTTLCKFQNDYFLEKTDANSSYQFYLPAFNKLSNLESEQLLGKLPPSQIQHENKFDSNVLTYFIACHSNKLSDAVIPLIQSILEKSIKTINIHIHIINANDSDLGNLVCVINQGNVGYRLSTENTDSDDPDYSSAIRCCRLFQYLQDFRSGVVSLDHNVIVKDGNMNFDNITNIGIINNVHEPIWQKVISAFIYLKPTKVSLDFMSNVSGAIAKHIISNPSKGLRFVEQVALYNATRFIRNSSLEITSVDQEYCDYTLSNESKIWVKNEHFNVGSEFDMALYNLKTRANDKLDRSFNKLSSCKYGQFIINKNDQYVGKSLISKGTWCEHELNLLKSFIAQDDIIIDAGANLGAFTIPFSELVGENGKVYSFEPQRIIFQALCGTVALNSRVNVYTFNNGLGESFDKLVVPKLNYLASNNFGGLALNSGDIEGEEIDVITIDSLQLRRLDLIKADVEGMELAILKGGVNTIKQFLPTMYLENHKNGKNYRELINYCKSLGYKLFWHGSSADLMMLAIHESKSWQSIKLPIVT